MGSAPGSCAGCLGDPSGEEPNLAAKAERLARKDVGKIREFRVKYLTDEKRIKAVTVCFTDLEGRLHMLDYRHWPTACRLFSDSRLTVTGDPRH